MNLRGNHWSIQNGVMEGNKKCDYILILKIILNIFEKLRKVMIQKRVLKSLLCSCRGHRFGS